MSIEKKKKWYEKWWVVVLLLPIFLLVWASQWIWKQKWDKKYRIAAIAALWGFVWINGLIVEFHDDKKASTANQQSWKCIGPDGKEIGLGQKDCEEFNKAWSNGVQSTNTQSTVVASTKNPVKNAEVKEEKQSLSPSLDEEKYTKFYTVKCGVNGLNGAVLVRSPELGKLEIIQRVPCYEEVLAYNDYYNDKLEKRYYAVIWPNAPFPSPDKGWVMEDFLEPK
ncbi:MAG: hypothetical protein H0W89_03570 [Candidatus Levybacteria bacterium]|nr:hypothetical protein [Candidatus Levybacteria bacterium]